MGRTNKTIAAVRRGVVLLLSPVLFLQACTTVIAPGLSLGSGNSVTWTPRSEPRLDAKSVSVGSRVPHEEA